MPCSSTRAAPRPDWRNASAFPPTEIVRGGNAAILASITSVHDVAAVHRQHLPGHERGVVGKQEEQRAAHVARKLRAPDGATLQVLPVARRRHVLGGPGLGETGRI